VNRSRVFVSPSIDPVCKRLHVHSFRLCDLCNCTHRDVLLLNGPVEHSLRNRDRIVFACRCAVEAFQPLCNLVRLQGTNLESPPNRVDEAFEISLLIVVGSNLAVLLAPVEIDL